MATAFETRARCQDLFPSELNEGFLGPRTWPWQAQPGELPFSPQLGLVGTKGGVVMGSKGSSFHGAPLPVSGTY